MSNRLRRRKLVLEIVEEMIGNDWMAVKEIVRETNSQLRKCREVSSKSIGQICISLFSNGTLERRYIRNSGFLEMFWRKQTPSNTNEPQVGNKAAETAGDDIGIKSRNDGNDRQTDNGSRLKSDGSIKSDNADERWKPALDCFDSNRSVLPKLYSGERTTQHGNPRSNIPCSKCVNGK